MLKIFSGLLLLSVYLNAASLELSEQLDYLFFGAFGMIVIYNLGYYLIMKDKMYADYFIYHFFILIIMLFYTGMFDSTLEYYNLVGVPVGLFLFASLALISFSKNLLNIQSIHPKMELYVKYAQFTLLGFFALSVFPIINTNAILVNMAAGYIILLAILLLGIAAYLSVVKKEMYAHFFLVSFIGVLLSVVMAFLSYFYVISLSPQMTHIIEFSLLFEASMFSFVMSYKHKETMLKLRQNELLFKELSHRVQNNLQSIISILSLQKSRVKELEIKEYLQDTINRIRTISLIHEKLQNSKEVAKADMNIYLNSMLEPYKILNKDITFQLVCVKGLYLNLEQLTPLALIINELITNSIKHAFLNVQSPKIFIILYHDSRYKFTYEDNGVGHETDNKSLGSMLIENLSTSQLKGEYKVDSKDKYNFTLTF